MNTEQLKQLFVKPAGFVRANFLYLLLAALVAGFAVIEMQKYLDRRSVERQSEIIKTYESEFERNRQENERLFEMFNKTHSATVQVLDGMKAMDGTIKVLVESDSRRETEMSNLREDYKNARNQTNTITKAGKTIYRDRRVSVPLGVRESDALRADAELYPGAN